MMLIIIKHDMFLLLSFPIYNHNIIRSTRNIYYNWNRTIPIHNTTLNENMKNYNTTQPTISYQHNNVLQIVNNNAPAIYNSLLLSLSLSLVLSHLNTHHLILLNQQHHKITLLHSHKLMQFGESNINEIRNPLILKHK